MLIEDVKRLLTAAEGKRPVQIRDRAALMLMAVYGLRLGEVGALCLEDFDWAREILTIPPGKSRRPDRAAPCTLRSANPPGNTARSV